MDNTQCKICSRFGHNQENCRDIIKKRHICSNSGHIERDCKKKVISKKCYNCSKFGHISKMCLKKPTRKTLLVRHREKVSSRMVEYTAGEQVNTLKANFCICCLENQGFNPFYKCKC